MQDSIQTRRTNRNSGDELQHSKPRRWPTLAQFEEALTTPNSCLLDLRFRDAHIYRDTNQRPKARAGRFAAVYKADKRTGSFALRVFLRPSRSRVQRLHQILALIQQHPELPLAVYEYQESGIRIEESIYPLMIQSDLSRDLRVEEETM